MGIEINNLTVEYKNGVKALDGISLSVDNGMFGLLGENGAGKTTLMRVLTTLLTKSSGEVFVNGVELIPKNYREIQNMIGYLPQELNMYPQLKVDETLEYLGQLSGIKKNEIKEKIEYYLGQTNLWEHRKKRIGQLSGGMKRRVGLVQAMITDPSILIVDEPTTGLDPEERIRIRNLLTMYAREHTVLFSTHVIEDISSTCNKLAIMRKGNILYQGNVSDAIVSAKGHLKTVYVHDENAIMEYEKQYSICTKQYGEKGIELKIMDTEHVISGTDNQVLTLEDAYIYLMNR